MNVVDLDTDPGEQWAQLPLLLTVPHAAKLMGISRSAAYRLALSRELPVKRLGGRTYVVTTKLRDFMEAA